MFEDDHMWTPVPDFRLSNNIQWVIPDVDTKFRWETFCNVFGWIGQVYFLASVNKFLIDDLAHSEELLEKAEKRIKKYRGL